MTQYELLTAAAFVAFAAARVKFAVVEAGLGGRLDATNVIPSKITVLTSVGLDHTEWLGDTLEEIAGEKLAVLRDHTTLITGRLPEEVEPIADEFVEARHARRERGHPAGAMVEGRPALKHQPAHGYPEQNFALAATAAAAALGHELEPGAVERAAEGLSNPGRAQVIEGDPRVILDSAHNPQGALALARVLPALAGGRNVVACIAVLTDKDAEGIVRALARPCLYLVCTEVPPEAIEGAGRPGDSLLGGRGARRIRA